MSAFDDIERAREFNEGFAYDQWWEDRAPDEEEEEGEEDGC